MMKTSAARETETLGWRRNPKNKMKLIFVYNAESGKLNTLFDIAHKVIKPETYKCYFMRNNT